MEIERRVTQKSEAAVAPDVGYTDPSHFAQLFPRGPAFRETSRSLIEIALEVGYTTLEQFSAKISEKGL